MLHKISFLANKLITYQKKLFENFQKKTKNPQKFKLNILVRDGKGVKIYNRNFGKNIK